MIRVVIIIFIIFNALRADYTSTKIQDYVNIVATQNNINIVTDHEILKEFDFFINKKIDGTVNIDVLIDLLDSNGYLLVKKTDNYYMIKAKKDLLINKIEIFNIKHADTQLIRDKAEQILKGYFKNVITYKSTSSKQETTPNSEMDPKANDKTSVKEVEERVNYSINILNNKSIAVTYKDAFVPEVIRTIINSIDKPPAIIRVTLKVYEVKTSALKQLGTEFDISTSFGKYFVSTAVNPIDGKVSIGSINDKSLTPEIRSPSFNAVIHALQSTGDAKVKAEPSVLLYEGKSSRLKDGKTYPIKNTDTTINNNTTTQTTKYIDKSTGLTISIHFKEMRDNFILLSMSLNINLVENYDINSQQIITVDRELINEMRVRPGQTVEIAGLTHSTKSESTGGIPFLMDIPWLGSIFSYTKTINEETILLMQLTANLVK